MTSSQLLPFGRFLYFILSNKFLLWLKLFWSWCCACSHGLFLFAFPVFITVSGASCQHCCHQAALTWLSHGFSHRRWMQLPLHYYDAPSLNPIEPRKVTTSFLLRREVKLTVSTERFPFMCQQEVGDTPLTPSPLHPLCTCSITLGSLWSSLVPKKVNVI